MSVWASQVKHKFQYAVGKDRVAHNCVFNLKPRISSSETPLIACSEKYWAVPYEGGGGPVFVSAVDAIGKVEPDLASKQCVNGHKAEVLAVAFSPFDAAVMATAGDDSVVNTWKLDAEAVAAKDVAALAPVRLGAHFGAARELAFHPLAQHVLASAGSEASLMLWDVEHAAECGKTDTAGAANCLRWSRDGRLVLASCRDRRLRLVDPRAKRVAAEATAHEGPRTFRAEFGPLQGHDHSIISCGPARSGGRELVVLDARNLEAPLFTKPVDASTGAGMPHFCDELSLLWLLGRGDTAVRQYEVDLTATGPDLALFPGVEWRTTSKFPHVGYTPLPHRTLDVRALEIARFLRLSTETVEALSFTVPRNEDLKHFFNDDLYFNGAPSGQPAVPCAADWLDQENPENNNTPVTLPTNESMRPPDMPLLSERRVQKTVLRTSVVNDELAEKRRQDEADKLHFARMSMLANQYEDAHHNTSMGSRPGVDAIPIHSDDVSDGEWDD